MPLKNDKTRPGKPPGESSGAPGLSQFLYVVSASRSLRRVLLKVHSKIVEIKGIIVAQMVLRSYYVPTLRPW